MTPRNKLGSAAYAFNSDTLDGYDSSAFAQLSTANTFTGTLGITTTSTTAFSVGAASTIFGINTTDGRVKIGAADSIAQVLALDTNTSDPGVGALSANGSMYYNSTSNKFRCYQAGAWTDCIGAGGGGGSTLQAAYTASTGGTTPIIKLDSTRGALTVQDADTTTGGTLFSVNASNASGLGSSLFSVGNTGKVAIKTTADSVDAFTVKDSSDFSVVKINTSTGEVNLGKVTQSGSAFGLQTTAGTYTDINAQNVLNASRYQTGASAGQTTAISVYVGGPQIDNSPSDKFRLAIYSDNAGSPGSKIAETAEGTITDIDWHTLPISATLSPNTNYWLAYISNPTSSGKNAMNYRDTGTGYTVTNSYGSGFPSSMSGGSPNVYGYSMYVDFVGLGTTPFTITSTGSVGIGTSTPLRQLEVKGTSLFTSTTNSSSMFEINGASSAKLFVVDSVNSRIFIGNPAGDANAVVLVVDNSSQSTDPAGTNGAMYYNTSFGRFRCYENGSWRNCTGSSSVGMTTVTQSMTAGTDVYLNGSAVTLPSYGLTGPSSGQSNGTLITWKVYLTKTAAGTAASTLTLRAGTAGTTADTARCTALSTGTATAAVDGATITVTAYATAGGPPRHLTVL